MKTQCDLIKIALSSFIETMSAIDDDAPRVASISTPIEITCSVQFEGDDAWFEKVLHVYDDNVEQD